MLTVEASYPIEDWPAYGWDQATKTGLFLSALNELTQHHKLKCEPYRRIVDKLWSPSDSFTDLVSMPFLPVRIFKHERLLSVPISEIVKTVTSSGTMSQSVSQVYLDKRTAASQMKVLSRITADFIGSKRLPLLIVDSKATVSDRLRFSARTAGIQGFSVFGSRVKFALNDDMSLDEDGVRRFLQENGDTPILIFGFTSIVWSHLVRFLEQKKRNIPMKNGILIHGGGWKKLLSEAVSALEFKNRLQEVTGIQKVHDYYGMAEQAGSIFMECSQGHLHSSVWSEVVIRDPHSYLPVPHGEIGLIQILSLIPQSYPGHSLLTEDEGYIVGIDDCYCGRKGIYFRVKGRLQLAEVRGCSDTYSS